ncbi:substrate-binding domain-containing protein [Vibrio agarivorans]|uniref:substrate-binding domain-containing protein n=1 Tax=Vibrio agarivorans TaxID=153622 RepID=UPI00222E1FF3|nr:substrate-binding domain-containing protein [Vibrio agarivorans]MDN3659628.1 helix-turn-helix domain-containing protein [Vibrio agarivorans]
MEKTLLLLLDSMIYYDRQILKGIKAKADELDSRLDIHLECPSNLDFILSRQWDYIIADYDKPENRQIVNTLNSKTVVITNHQEPGLPSAFSVVQLDNAGLANTALQAFAKRNIENVSYFANQRDFVTPWSSERASAFAKTAQLSGLNYIENAESALKERKFPLGIYCSSDRSACRMASLCKSMKLKVPEQVSIIGTDCDDTERMLSAIPLSSVELNPLELGKLCFETLDKLIRYKRTVRVEFSSYKLIHAQTTLEDNSVDPIVVKAESFIRNHFHINMKIKQVTDHCRVSRKTLDTRFLIAHRMTAHQYLTHLRLERAKHLLLTTNEKLEAIAKQCGYPGQSYLSQVFLKQFGLAPVRYRIEKGQGMKKETEAG